MTHYLKLFTIFAALVCCAGGDAKKTVVTSPDGRLTATISDDDGLTLSVSIDGKVLLQPSAISMTLADGTVIGKNAKTGKARTTTVIDDTDAPFYRQRHIKMAGRQTDIKLDHGFGLQVRAYNEGVAYRYYTTCKGETIILDETADFIFAANNKAWLSYSTNQEKPFAMAFQNTYHETVLCEARAVPAFLPATVVCDGTKVTILESDLRSYPGMFVVKEKQTDNETVGTTSLKAVFARYPRKMDYYKWRGMSYVSETELFIAKSTGKRTYPWRILAVSEKDTDMPVNNLVYTLAAPNWIGDTSWLKPGKVAWDWWHDWNLRGVDFKAGINTTTYRYYIDFAAKNGLSYVVLDEGWYDSNRADIMHPIADIDLQQLIDYGREKGVGIVLWTVFNVLDEHLQEVCEHYSKMGVKGFKVDFLDRNDQTAVEMAERIAKTCATHRLLLDYHGYFAPTGMSRTYPNLLNYEGVFGMEECRWAKKTTDMPRYDVTFPFIRGMAGSVDFTPGAMRNGTRENWVECYQNPVSMGTRCHQAACYVVHDSPFTMLCDAPTSYEREPDYTSFIAGIPDEWDETRVLQGEIGKYIVTARRKGDTWYVGGQTNWDERRITLPLNFLGEGSFLMTLLYDGINADHNAEDYLFDRRIYGSNDTLTVQMASGGGFVAKIKK